MQLKTPNELTAGQRFLLTIIIVLVILFALAAFGYFSGRWGEAEGAPQEVQLYQGISFDAHLLPMDKRALEEAYRQQLLLLWSVWLKDGAQDPTRFQNGLRNARRAYHLATTQIEKREKELEKQK